jgi:hypothetical protein
MSQVFVNEDGPDRLTILTENAILVANPNKSNLAVISDRIRRGEEPTQLIRNAQATPLAPVSSVDAVASSRIMRVWWREGSAVTGKTRMTYLTPSQPIEKKDDRRTQD